MTSLTHPNLIERLKPCPFCGTAMLSHDHCFSHPYPSKGDCFLRHYSFDNRHIEAWNTRTNDQAISTLTAEVEELRDGLNRAHYCLIILNSHTPADIRENVNQAKAIIDATLTKGEGDKLP